MYSTFTTLALAGVLAFLAMAAPAPTPLVLDFHAREVAVRFTNAFPEYFCANSRQTLFWQGGSGTYDVNATLHYAGHDGADDKVCPGPLYHFT